MHNTVKTIGVVTVARSDYGIYLPVLRKIHSNAALQLQLIVSGMHLSPEFGHTVDIIRADGFSVGDEVKIPYDSDAPEGVATTMGFAVQGFARSFANMRPDLLVVLGDRFEMCAAALAALPLKIPVAHIHGGELGQGGIDDALRHAMTKLSHLHFVATADSARRVKQLGEEPWRVIVSGAPSLDNLQSMRLLTVSELEAKYGFTLDPAPLLVTFHPVTLEYEQTEWQVQELLSALQEVQRPLIFSTPNADTSNRVLRDLIETFIHSRTNAWIGQDFGTQDYFSLMAIAAAMIGNSSSGILEATSFQLPSLQIGNRQNGRLRAANVIDVDCDRRQIREGLHRVLSPAFRESLRTVKNPYYRENAAGIIVEHLSTIVVDDKLLMKRFYDLPAIAPS